MKFGRTVQQLRHDAGLTQEDLARRTGLTTVCVAQIEQGRRTKPVFGTVVALARALAEPTDLFATCEEWRPRKSR